MDKDVSDLLNQLFGVDAKVVGTGRGVRSLLEFLESDESKAEGCSDECPIHGKGGLRDALKPETPERPYGSTVEGLDAGNVTPEIATSLAVGAALGSQTKIELGKYDHAERMQEQSFLWMRLAEILREQQPWQAQIQQVIDQADAKLGDLRNELDDVKSDREELRRELADKTERYTLFREELETHRASYSRLLQGSAEVERERDALKAELEAARDRLEEARPVSE